MVPIIFFATYSVSSGQNLKSWKNGLDLKMYSDVGLVSVLYADSNQTRYALRDYRGGVNVDDGTLAPVSGPVSSSYSPIGNRLIWYYASAVGARYQMRNLSSGQIINTRDVYLYENGISKSVSSPERSAPMETRNA